MNRQKRDLKPDEDFKIEEYKTSTGMIAYKLKKRTVFMLFNFKLFELWFYCLDGENMPISSLEYIHDKILQRIAARIDYNQKHKQEEVHHKTYSPDINLLLEIEKKRDAGTLELPSFTKTDVDYMVTVKSRGALND